MTYAVVTTFSPKGYEVYGKKLIETFAQFWPADVPLHAYYEGDKKPDDANERAIWHALDNDVDRDRFMLEHKDGDPRDYRTCVVRYSHKVFAITGAPRETENLIWVDADCETFAPVTHDMLKGVCADPGQVGSFLHRPYHRHSETGFWSVRFNNCGDDFLDELRRLYTSGDVLNLSEHHDCMAFDFIRRRFERAGHRFKNLCPDARGLDVFIHSRLKHFVRHYKGPEAKLKVYGDHMSGSEEAA